MKKMSIPCFVAPVSRVPDPNLIDGNRPQIPVRQVQCHCPQACWVALSTIAAVEAIDGKPTYYCSDCCPDDVRESIEAMSTIARAEMAAGRHDPGQPVGGFIFGAANYNKEVDDDDE